MEEILNRFEKVLERLAVLCPRLKVDRDVRDLRLAIVDYRRELREEGGR